MILNDAQIATLTKQGCLVVENALPREQCFDLLAAAQAAYTDGVFREARVGRGAKAQQHAQIRRDQIAWVDESGVGGALLLALEFLRAQLNQTLLLGLFEVEAHFACYQPGDFYGRHRDAFAGDRGRVLSVVYYLNPDWSASDGGALRLYFPDGSEQDVLPQANRMVLFLSEQFDHEVLPATRERWSIAAWFRVRGLL